jgi:hypothetical protein
MQTLVFNTTTKTITVYEGPVDRGQILFEMSNIPTVKPQEGYYEVMQKDESDRAFPVLRLGISSTNMFIKK